MEYLTVIRYKTHYIMYINGPFCNSYNERGFTLIQITNANIIITNVLWC